MAVMAVKILPKPVAICIKALVRCSFSDVSRLFTAFQRLLLLYSHFTFANKTAPLMDES